MCQDETPVTRASSGRARDGGARKALVARLWVRAHLGDQGRLRGITDPTDDALDHFEELATGAFSGARWERS